MAPSSKVPPTSATSQPIERLRLGTTPSPSANPNRLSTHSRSSSVETQIYAPISLSPSSATRHREERDEVTLHGSRPAASPSASVKTKDVSSEQLPPIRTERSLEETIGSSKHSKSARPSERDNHDNHITTPDNSTIQQSRESAQSATPVPKLTSISSTDTKMPSKPHAPAVRIRDQAISTPAPYTILVDKNKQYKTTHDPEAFAHQDYYLYGKVPLAERAFVPERPPSPPATPSSGRSPSLQTQISRLELSSPPPPVPKLNPRRKLLESSSKRNDDASRKTVVQDASSEKQSHFRPNLPEKISSLTRARASSFDGSSSSATFPSKFPTSLKEAIDADASRRDPHNSPSKTPPLFVDDDADLESLPSTIDFEALPWCNHNISPAIFREGELNAQNSPLRSPALTRASTIFLEGEFNAQNIPPQSPALTRASSFDSAAPPPIALDRRMPSVFANDPLPASPARPNKLANSAAPKTPKKPKPSLSSLSFFRSAPKAILYSQTVPGIPPIPISVSRTAVPSIPALFPDYKGQFPPPQKQHDQSPFSTPRTGSLNSLPTPQQQQQQKKEKERGRGPPRTAKNQSQQKRGSSVPTRPGSRRRSWFKTDQLDKAFATVGADERRGIE